MHTRSPDSYEEVQVRQAVTHGRTLWVPVSVNNFPVEAVIDTGAEITIVSEEFASRLGKLGFLQTLEPIRLCGFGMAGRGSKLI